MRRKVLLSSSLLLAVAMATATPSIANAQPRGRGGTRVVVAGGFGPYYSPFFYDPFFGPWGGPWGGWGGWGGPFGWGYPYGGYRWTNDASVRLDVKPRDAQVYVDGYFAGEIDQFDGRLQRLHVPPGTHEIVIYREGYKSIRERLYLAPNSSRKLTHDLDRLAAGEPNEPLPQPAAQPERDVNGPPDGPDGPDGPDDRGLPPGPPPMPRRGDDPRDGRRPPQPPVARRAPRTGSTGTVAIRVQPGDAEVLIDGERWAGGDEDERLIVQLAEGPHHIEVQKDGYRRVSLDVQVRRGETQPVNVSLSRN